MWIFVPRSVVIGQGMVGTGAALLAILIVVGMIHAAFVGAFAAISAGITTVGLMIVASAFRWNADLKLVPLFRILLNAFMAMTVVTWVFDLALGTHYAVPTMIVALDHLACDPFCPPSTFANGHPPALIQSVSDFYAFNVTGVEGGWLRYTLQQLPGLIAFAWVLGSGEPRAFQPAQPEVTLYRPGGHSLVSVSSEQGGIGRNRLWRLLAASTACVAIALGVAFPIFVSLMIALRTLGQ